MRSRGKIIIQKDDRIWEDYGLPLVREDPCINAK